MSRAASAAEILERSIWLLRRGAGRCALVLILLTVGAAAAEDVAVAEVEPRISLGVELILLASGIVAQLWLIRAALADIGAPPPRHLRVGAFFLLSFLYFAASALGLLALLLPGILIAVRWWVAAPLMIERGIPPLEALAASWRETEDRFWPVLAVVAIFWLPVLAALGVVVWSAFPADPGPTAALMTSVVANGTMILAALSSVAAYSALEDPEKDLPEVFA